MTDPADSTGDGLRRPSPIDISTINIPRTAARLALEAIAGPEHLELATEFLWVAKATAEEEALRRKVNTLDTYIELQEAVIDAIRPLLHERLMRGKLPDLDSLTVRLLDEDEIRAFRAQCVCESIVMLAQSNKSSKAAAESLLQDPKWDAVVAAERKVCSRRLQEKLDNNRQQAEENYNQLQMILPPLLTEVEAGRIAEDQRVPDPDNGFRMDPGTVTYLLRAQRTLATAYANGIEDVEGWASQIERSLQRIAEIVEQEPERFSTRLVVQVKDGLASKIDADALKSRGVLKRLIADEEEGVVPLLPPRMI